MADMPQQILMQKDFNRYQQWWHSVVFWTKYVIFQSNQPRFSIAYEFVALLDTIISDPSLYEVV